MSSTTDFDRLRPRTPTRTRGVVAQQVDADGKRALYSSAGESGTTGTLGTVEISCETCRETTVMGIRAAIRVALFSIFAPLLKPRHPLLARCPGCSQMTWLHVRLVLPRPLSPR
jgi:hypothetical protein